MIYDVEGLGLKHLWKPAIETFGEVRPHGFRRSSQTFQMKTLPTSVFQILTMFEDNYPEGLKRLFVIKGGFGGLHEPPWTPVELSSCVSRSPQTLSSGLQPGEAFPV